MNGKRPKIALLAANLIDDFSASISKGAMAAAERLGADLFIFPGKYLCPEIKDTAFDVTYEYQYNLLFSHAAQGGFDYIIAPVGSIGYALNRDEKKAFLDSLGPSPVLCVAADIEGYDSLIFDNSSGMFAIVDELVSQGRKHIAVMAGECNNIDCVERTEAVRTRLEYHGIAFDERYCQYCSLDVYSRKAAIELLDRCPDTDAVICVNDSVAFEVCAVLKERGTVIGRDVAVTGFDDIPRTAEYDPPIATVHADAVALGERAVEIAAARIRGENVAAERFATDFILRDSCRRERTTPVGYERIGQDERRALKQKVLDKMGADNVFVRDVMMFGTDLKYSYAKIMKQLPIVGAMTGFLYTFPQPLRCLPEEDFPKDVQWIFRSYSYGSEVFTVPEDEQRVTPFEIYENSRLCAERQHCMVVIDLYSAEMQYGIALLEPKDPDFFSEVELITYIFSSAVRTLNILHGQEKLLSELNIRNLALEKESKRDELTGLLNRRGFYLAAERLISSSEEDNFIVCYADLDDLKTVNDVHGHLEGDFSLRLTAECLQKVFGEDAVIGRTGGDEYNVILPCRDSGDVAGYTEAKESFVREFNETGKKPYRFGVSIGMLEFRCENSYDLRAALDKADDLLYAAKQKRKREKIG